MRNPIDPTNKKNNEGLGFGHPSCEPSSLASTSGNNADILVYPNELSKVVKIVYNDIDSSSTFGTFELS